ncbi:uncharacterized protein F5147DRAFT_572403, partial [Suillus discolor]
IVQAFFLPPPAMSSVPYNTIYPDPGPIPISITESQLSRSIAKLSPYKAPRPDRICNIIFICCAALLESYLLHLLRATFTLKTFLKENKLILLSFKVEDPM